MKKHLLFVAAILSALSLGAASACGSHSDNSSDSANSECVHTYDNACDADCNVCGDERTPAEHVYDNACDADCNVCGAERTPSEHVYDNACDVDCNVCGDERTPSEHVYENACDADCNVCGDERTPSEHVYDADCDADCNVCGAERTASEHVYDADCDADCNVCGAERTASEHVYDNACDVDCNVCGDERTPSEHVYDNACDVDCNVCGDERTPSEHVYDNEGDKTCNECGDIRELSKYMVTFIVDGSAVSSSEIEYGAMVQAPAQPEKDCYAFKGWVNGDVAYDFSSPVTGVLNLTASWEQTHAYYTVKVMKDGEDVTAEYSFTPTKAAIGEEIDITEIAEGLTAPEGYAFNMETSILSGTLEAEGLTLELYLDKVAYETEATYVTADRIVYNKISTLEQLRAITGTDGNYILVNDIDAENAVYANTTFLGDFAGVLEGNGYSIKNVQIQAANEYWGSGLFGTLSGTIRNIGLENITMLGGTSNYLGKSGFIAQTLTGKVINVYLTGTVSGVIHSHGSWSADYRYGIIAYEAVGATVYNVRAHVDGMVKYSASLVAKTAPTHWGNYYASYTGTVSHVYGTSVPRDVGGTCLEASKESGDAAVIDQTFNNTYNGPLEADVAPYVSNDYWNMETVELKENIYGLKVVVSES